MQLKTQALVAAVVAAFVAQGAIAADAPKKKATAGECAEQAQMPKAGSEKSRADVKAEGKGAAGECDASPAPKAKSQKHRAEVKKEVKEAVKSGEMSNSDALEKPKK